MHAKTVFLFVLSAVLIVGCLPQPSKTEILANVANTPNELLYHDVFASRDFVSTNITVLGVSVGMSEADVFAKLGKADVATESDFGGVKDWGYSTSLGLNSSGVIYHMEQGTVTRIIVTRAMTPLLHGNATAGKTKDEVYSAYGIPDRQYDFTFFTNTKPVGVDASTGRFFVYNVNGFESYLAKGIEYQYAFVYPMRKLPSLAFQERNLTKEELLNPVNPILLTDTTTLCNQGKTFGYSPSSLVCIEYENACAIPDNWIEITNCANVPQPVPTTAQNNTTP